MKEKRYAVECFSNGEFVPVYDKVFSDLSDAIFVLSDELQADPDQCHRLVEYEIKVLLEAGD
jgi:hypothetical protein